MNMYYVNSGPESLQVLNTVTTHDALENAFIITDAIVVIAL